VGEEATVFIQQTMSYNWGRRRNRLRKGKRGITSSNWYSSRAMYRPIYNKHRRSTPEWGGLHRAWVGYIISKSQDDYEKMGKYAITIREFERRLNIAINDFPEIGIFGFKEDFENTEEDDDSKLAVYDPWNREKIRDSKEGEDEDEDEDEDADDDNYHSWHRE
jgi:hypothetical protein